MTLMSRRQLVFLVLLSASGCLLQGCEDEITIVAPTAPDPPPSPIPDRVEFRVLGTFESVTVRHVTAQDGTAVVETGLPFFSAFQTTSAQMFLSLTVQANGDGFLQLQILVNGNVVREATSTTDDPHLAISVTYRRGDQPSVPVPV
jgi:hypothetical protein